MVTTAQRFENLIQALQIHQDEYYDDAIECHQTVREWLLEDPNFLLTRLHDLNPNVRRILQLIAATRGERIFLGVFLSGSYKRRTAICPIHDVDMFVVVNKQFGALSPSEMLSFLSTTIKLKARIEPARVKVDAQNRSVGVEYFLGKSRRMAVNLDVVPAIAAEPTETVFWIPDGERNVWMKSNPAAALSTLTAANGQSGGRLFPLIKLVKDFNRSLEQRLGCKVFKSFHLEVMCYPFGAQLGQLPDFNFRKGFMWIIGQLAQVMISRQRTLAPGFDDQYVDDYMFGGGALLLSAQRSLQEAEKLAYSAVQCEQLNDHANSHAYWKRLFSSY